MMKVRVAKADMSNNSSCNNEGGEMMTVPVAKVVTW